MLKTPAFSHVSTGSRNVVSHRYVSSSATSAVCRLSVLAVPGALRPIVMLLGGRERKGFDREKGKKVFVSELLAILI